MTVYCQYAAEGCQQGVGRIIEVLAVLAPKICRKRSHVVRVLLTVLVGLPSAGCETGDEPGLSVADETAIRAGVEAITGAANRRDHAGWAAIYTDDAVLLPPNGSAIEGRSAIQAWLSRLPPTSHWEIGLDELEGRDDLAFVRGGYTRWIEPSGEAPPVAEHGRVVQIWRKQADGSWSVLREILNSDNPSAVPW